MTEIKRISQPERHAKPWCTGLICGRIAGKVSVEPSEARKQDRVGLNQADPRILLYILRVEPDWRLKLNRLETIRLQAGIACPESARADCLGSAGSKDDFAIAFRADVFVGGMGDTKRHGQGNATQEACWSALC